MKLLGTILLWVSLTVGILGAASAYLVSLDLPDNELVGLTLNAPAGVIEAGSKREPLLKKGTQLDAGHLQTLHNHGVAYVQVREFSLVRWPGRWVFLLALAGLGVAAVLLKRAGHPAGVTGAATSPQEGPQAALSALLAGVESLARTLPELPTVEARLLSAREQLERLQQTHLQAFLEARPELISQLGLMRSAEVMGRFASGERQIYRAWSAAADGICEEVLDCLTQAREHLDGARIVLENKPLAV